MAEWQPIETAPRDGSAVLVVAASLGERWSYLNGRAFVASHQGRTTSGFDLGWSLFPGFGGVDDASLAGWMPLPAPPETKE